MNEFTKGELELCSDSLGLAQIEGKIIFVVFPSMCNTPEDLALRIANSKELVRRWNSQPDLLKALEEALKESHNPKVERILDVAIAKAAHKP